MSSSPVGAIAGGVIGGLLAVVLLAGAAYIIISKRNRRAKGKVCCTINRLGILPHF